ncbi:MAG: TA system VapC family ribonuclease toxin [Actinomycetota bacterium]
MEERAREEPAGRRPRRSRRTLRVLGATLIAVDANVLVYAFRQEFELYELARSALRDLAEGDEAWGLPIFAIGEFFRVVTHPRYLDPPATSALVMNNVEGLLASPSCKLLLPGDRHFPLLRVTVEEARATGNLIFDAQIVAVCLEHGADEVLTEDADMRRFPSIRVRGLADQS